MRVITGRFKGRQLKAPDWAGLRPSADRLKETLFNILALRVEGARVLDGFAGSGALGIEALSRGAVEVVFIERDPRAVSLIEANLAHCGVRGGYVMIRGALPGALAHVPASQRFDLVLLDPPYDEADVAGVLAAALARLAPGGVLVVEHAKRRRPPERVGAWACVRRVVSGASGLSFYREADVPAGDDADGEPESGTSGGPPTMEES